MLRVCLVDDDALLLAGMQRALRRASPPISLTLASSGAMALAALASEPIDLLMSDLSMPGMDGQALLATAQTRFPCISRVLSTGALDPYRAFDLQLVAHRVVTKPMATSALFALMHEFDDLNRQHHASEALRNAPEIPWAFAAARRLREQRPSAITAAVARNNPWLAMLLLQATHGGFVSADRPLDVESTLRVLGTERLAIMLERLKAFETPTDRANCSGKSRETALSAAGAIPVSALLELTREIALRFAPLHAAAHTLADGIAPTESTADFLAVAESAALLRAASDCVMSGDTAHRHAVLVCARDAARMGVAPVIVEAVRESADDATQVSVSAGAAVGWASALLRDPELLHSPAPQIAVVGEIPPCIRDRWRELSLASRNARRSAA